MRNSILACALFLSFVATSFGQIKTPQASPTANFEQAIGLTEVKIDYSRPSMKGRTIYGDLVPFDKIWRTGANAYTKITFSTDVKVGGKDLKKGTYSLFTKPGKTSWDVYFYTDINGGGVPSDWDDSKVAATFTVNSVKLPVSFETFLINLSNLRNGSADLQLVWENTLVPITIEVPTSEIVMANIDKVMGGPSAGDYYSAASYYLDEKTDLDKAYEYINKSIAMDNEKFWVVRRKALIEAELGKYPEAIKSAEKSLALAKEAGNDDYVKMNTDSIAEWKAMK